MRIMSADAFADWDEQTYLHEILGADEPISLLVKNPEGLPNVSLDVRVLELPGRVIPKW